MSAQWGHEERFAQEHRITLGSTFLGHRTEDGLPYAEYNVQLHRPSGRFPGVLIFRCGGGLPGPPTVGMVLKTVADDVATLLNAETFEGWARELDFDVEDPDSRRKATATWRAVQEQADGFREWLGDALDELLWPETTAPQLGAGEVI